MKNALVAVAAALSLATSAGAGVQGPLKVSPDGRTFVGASECA
jgi:predicted small lipoprotein YifL